jgi:hypothetical protein
VIERGAIEIEGRVKFKQRMTKEQIQNCFDKYRTEVERATAGLAGAPLFDTTKTMVKTFSGFVEDSSIPFEFRLVFRPAELDQELVKTKPEQGGQ